MKKKRALCAASVASILDNFNRENVDVLLELGYDVTLASNFQTEESNNSQEKIDAFVKEMHRKGVHTVQIEFSRHVRKIGRHLQSAWQIHGLLRDGFDLIHCHSPICAAIVRMAAEKYRRDRRTQVVYTAHGFHFFKGAPLLNWLIFYPIEKWLSRYTDILITINHEDYRLARHKFFSGKTVLVPGAGVDLEKFAVIRDGRQDIRHRLGIRENDMVLCSVGELNANKNHELVIRALPGLGQKKCSGIRYLICGQGRQKDRLLSLIRKLHLQKSVQLLGYRDDIADILQCTDIFLFPSKREGLPVALIEAMAMGVPCIAANIRGNTDLLRNGVSGILLRGDRRKDWAEAIEELLEKKELRERYAFNARESVHRYSLQNVKRKMKEIYRAV